MTMIKFYEKKPILFAVLWIVLYCVVSIPIRGELGDESVWMLVGLAAIAAAITAFVKIYHLEEKYGLTGFPKDIKRYWYFIPVCILVTGNLWGGFALAYSGAAQVFAVLSKGHNTEHKVRRGRKTLVFLPRRLFCMLFAASAKLGYIIFILFGDYLF